MVSTEQRDDPTLAAQQFFPTYFIDFRLQSLTARLRGARLKPAGL
jgi:hypothetical protein